MKKLVLILSLFVAVFAVNAQQVIEPGDKAIKVYDSGSDTIVAAESFTFIIKNMDKPVNVAYSVAFADHSGGNTGTMTLSGSVDGTNYKVLATKSYSGVGTDTVIIDQLSSAVSYPKFKLTVTPSDTLLMESFFAKVTQ